MLSDSGLYSSGLTDTDVHASPVNLLSISSLVASNPAQQTSTNGTDSSNASSDDSTPPVAPLVATEGSSTDTPPVAQPLVQGVFGDVSVVFTDLGGNPISEVQAGQQFMLKLYVTDTRTGVDLNGFFSAYAGVTFDSSLVSVADPNSLAVDSFFTGLSNFVEKDTSTAGLVRAGGTSTNSSPTFQPGDPQLLWSVTLQSTGTDNSQVTFTPKFEDFSDMGTAQEWLLYGLETDTLTADNFNFQASSLSIVGHPSISIDNVSHLEGNTANQTYLFTVSLSSATTDEVTVAYQTQDGTALAGSDYTAASGTLTFNGTTQQVITVTVAGDQLTEPDEQFTIALSDPTNALLDVATGTGTIQNDDESLLGITGVSQPEGDTSGTMLFTVTLNHPSSTPITVNYATQDGTATTAGNDYTATSGTLTFAANSTASQIVTVTILGDQLTEPDEQFQVLLSNPQGAAFDASAGMATGTIQNDDNSLLGITSVSQPEGDTTNTMLFTVTLSNPSSTDITVNFATQDGTATTAGNDYTATSGTLTFAANSTASQIVTVTILGDQLTESDEDFQVVLSNPQGATLDSSQGMATGTIQNDDESLLGITGVSQPEGDTTNTMLFTVTLSNPSSTDITVNFATQDGTATTAGNDYTATSGTLTFAANSTAAQVITVTILGDTNIEPDETFQVLLSEPLGATFDSSEGTATGTLQNDDNPKLSFSPAQMSQLEGNDGSVMVFTVTISKASDSPVTVVYQTEDGTATTANNDYTATSGTLTFAADNTDPQFVTVPIIGDTVSEFDETFSVKLSGAENADILAGTATGTLQNDDGPTLAISGPQDQHEDANNGVYVLTATLSEASVQDVTVVWSTADGSATTAGNDYTATSGTLTFIAGTTTQLFTVQVTPDTIVENDEQFNIELTDPVQVTLPQTEFTAAILNDDLPSLTITGPADQHENANNGVYVLTATLSQASVEDVTVAWNTADGSATTANNDYTATSGTLTFTAGTTTQMFTVQVTPDTTVESDEQFNIELSGSANVTLASSEFSAAILNDDVTLAITGPADQHENANNGQYVLTATLSGVSDQTVTVVWNTADGSATTLNNDYTATSGTLTFTAGTTTQLFTVQVTPDTNVESDEQFNIQFSNPVNVSPPQTFSAAILNDDLPTVSISAPSAQNEGNSGNTNFIFTVTLSTPVEGEVTVAYQTVDGIATVADNDYLATSGTLTFASLTSTQTVTVQVVGDTRHENANETFRVDLSDPVGATLSSTLDKATGTIVDDDNPPSISIADMSHNEGDSGTTQFVFTVMLSNTSINAVTVAYQTQDGTAIAGSDYTATSGTLTFAADTTSQTLTVNVLGDLNKESDETFTVALSNPANGSLSKNSAVGTIVDESTDSVQDLPSVVSGRVFVDGNDNGVQNAYEAPLGNVPVFLTGDATQQTTTAADGSYSFAGLNPGTYTVTFNLSALSEEYHAGHAVIGDQGGGTATNGYTFTLASPGGVAAGGYHFVTVGPTHPSQRMFLASTLQGLATPSPSVVSVLTHSVTDPINASNVTATAISGVATAGSSISVVVSDGTTSLAPHTAQAATDGTWSITGINVVTLADGTLTYSVTASGSDGGSAQTSTTATKDTVAPTLAIGTVSDPVNVGNVSALSITGTSSANQLVTVTVSDGTNTTDPVTATADANGDWSLGSIDLSALASGTITYTASATDAVGNTATVTQTATKDTEAPTVAITSLPDTINAANQNAVSISGTGEVGDTISLLITDAATGQVTPDSVVVGQDGTWSFTGIDVSSLAEGTIDFSVTATDAASNTSQTSQSANKDTEVAVIITESTTDPITPDNETNTSVTGGGEAGATVSVVASDGTGATDPMTVTVDSESTWTVSGIDVSGLADGTITYTATITDAAGNTDAFQFPVQKDTTAPSLTVDSSSDPIGIGNQKHVTVGGTVEPGATVSVVVSDGTNSTDAADAQVGQDGNWSLADIDVSGLNDGTLTFMVTATDAVNNLSTDNSLTATKTTVAVDEVTDTIVQSNEAAFPITGTGQVGATISVVASDGTNTTDPAEITIDDSGIWSVPVDVSSLDDGSVTFTITASEGGESIVETQAATKTTVVDGAVGMVTDPISMANMTNAAISGTGPANQSATVTVTDGNDTTDPQTVAIDSDGNWSVTGIDVSSLADGTITYTATVSDDLGNETPYEMTATKDTMAPDIGIASFTNPIGIGDLTSTSISGTAGAGDAITVSVTDGTTTSSDYQATADANGDWSIDTIDVSDLADGMVTFSIMAEDAVGNQSTTTQDSVKATLTVDDVSGEMITQENQSGFGLSGAGEVGATISIVATDGTDTTDAVETTVGQDGLWSLPVDVTSLTDGTITFTVTATSGQDSIDNDPSNPITVDKDTVAEAAVTDFTNPINLANAGSVLANGTGEVGATLSIVAVDESETATDPANATVQGDGTWSVTGIDTTGLADGTITFQLTVTDTLGNQTTYDMAATATKDIVAPTFDISGATDPIGVGDLAMTMINGTGEEGDTITVTVSDEATHTTDPYQATVGGDGLWSIDNIDVNGLDDGTLSFMVTATDAAGNTTTDNNLTVTKTTVSINQVTDPINAANQHAVEISGGGDPGVMISVVASDGTTTTAPAAGQIDGTGHWSISDFDVSSLADGDITFTVTATVGANSAQQFASTRHERHASRRGYSPNPKSHQRSQRWEPHPERSR